MFSLDDFKKWMETQEDSDHPELVRVRSKISPKKLMEKMHPEEGDEEEMAREFAKLGGILIETNDGLALIDVKSGRFSVKEKYVEQI
ncbi:MAG: hypothetical protein DWQ19_12535 [Crenarchaeota archaeon]|nr:MAG: hypothetical protein DWQ19_12535 [Thermoproteota archaeon]